MKIWRNYRLQSTDFGARFFFFLPVSVTDLPACSTHACSAAMSFWSPRTPSMWPTRLPAQLDGLSAGMWPGPISLDCVRRVARGQRCIQRTNVTMMQSARQRGHAMSATVLTPKEMQIVALIVQGCKNKEIAIQLGTKEQVIKNYLRSIYDKTGVSDRLELALFTIHHRVLAEAAAKAGNLIQMKTA